MENYPEEVVRVALSQLTDDRKKSGQLVGKYYLIQLWGSTVVHLSEDGKKPICNPERDFKNRYFRQTVFVPEVICERCKKKKRRQEYQNSLEGQKVKMSKEFLDGLGFPEIEDLYRLSHQD